MWNSVSVKELFSTENVVLDVFPNPFTTSTTIAYELQQPATVQISIYNHLGERVALVAEKYQPKGKHQLTRSFENLPAGVYYCVLKTEKGIQTAKMVKMK